MNKKNSKGSDSGKRRINVGKLDMANQIKYNDVKSLTSKSGDGHFYKVNRDLLQEFFLDDKEILNADIYVQRIFANICVTLSDAQFHINNENFSIQLKLFEEEFRSKDNSAIIFTMPIKEVFKESRIKRLEKSLAFLVNYKSQWYTSKNAKGESIRSYGGLISDPVINQDTGRFRFAINSHWLEKILHLTEFNKTYYNLTQYITSNKQMIFWYWLICLPDAGTKVNYKTLNEKFDLNYKDARSLVKGFLKPIKIKFDQYAHISFNFSYSEDKINIAKYLRTIEDFGSGNRLSDRNKEKLNKSYKLWYLTKRHLLTEFEKGQIKQIFKHEKTLMNSSYTHFVKECQKKGVKTTDLTNGTFLKEFQKSIIVKYQETLAGKKYPTAYPKVI